MLQLELKGYDELGNLSNDEDVCEELLDYSDSTYICDAILEVADNNVPIYTSEIWERAQDIQEYISEAQSQGLTEGVDDIERIMQMGFYQYYTQLLYNNLDTIAYNYIAKQVNEFLNGLEEEKIAYLDITDIEDEVENEVYNTDNNDRFSDLSDIADNIISNIEDTIDEAELEEEEEEEDEE